MTLAAAAIAFLFAVSVNALLRPVAKTAGLIDRPGGHKIHTGEIPLTGGIAMFLGMFAALRLLPDPGYPIVPLFVASALLVVTGAVDDRQNVHAFTRLAAQVVAALVMVYGAGMSLASIGSPFGTGEIRMGSATLIFTILVTLTMINAYNLVDGIDGLAGSLALIALLAVAAIAGGEHPAGTVAISIAAAIFGFLVFNYPTSWSERFRTFMGDSGSTLLGFTIVWVTLGISTGPDRLISPVPCLWFASIPIFDTLTCFVRRALRGKSPIRPGQDHFHHILLRAGLGVRGTLALLAGLQAIHALIGLAGYVAQVPDSIMFTAWALTGLSQRIQVRAIARRYRSSSR